jgi:heparin binding hemagglutinin HbhA
MTATDTVKHYGETVVTTGRTVAEQLVERSRTPLLAVLGAGDVAFQATREAVESLRSRAEALPGEAQVQADLAAKEARARVQEVRTATRPDAVLGTVSTLVDAARTQVEALAVRGAGVVDELRRQPAFRTVLRRAEGAVDTVEDALEEVLEETAETVAGASDEVTSVAQKAAAKTAKAAKKAEAQVEEAADATKATVRSAEKPTCAATKATPEPLVTFGLANSRK